MNSWALARRAASRIGALGRAAAAVGDVLADRAVEEERVLLDDREERAVAR